MLENKRISELPNLNVRIKYADCGGKGNIRNENPWKIETKLCDVIPKVYSSGCIDSVIQARN